MVSKSDTYSGMMLRDWFAGQALAGMTIIDDGDYSKDAHAYGTPSRKAEFYARAAYRIADAMLAERAKIDQPNRVENSTNIFDTTKGGNAP